jgi:tetratricopeptide (TPR) repeat protein
MAGEPAVAAAAFEAAVASSAIPAADKAPLLAAAAGQYYTANNYAKAGDACARYFQEGGSDPAMRTLQIQALYLGGDMAKAAHELQVEVKAAEAAGKVPAEQQLQMLADVANRQKDSAGFIGAMEKLVTHYPKKDYWASLMYSVSTRSGLSTQLALDVLRLKLATGTMRTVDEYVEAAQLAIQAGFPAEAKKFVDAGYDAKMMGTGAGPDIERHKRLRDTAAKGLAEDTKSLGLDDAKVAAAANGDPLMNTGLNYVLRGQADKGLPMMEQALKKGGFKRGEDAKLHLGFAQLLAGQKAKAIETLRTVKGTDGAAEIARLWVLYAQR